MAVPGLADRVEFRQSISAREFRGPGHAQQHGLAKVGPKDLQAYGKPAAAIKIGAATGHGNGTNAGEIGRQRKNIR